MLATATVLDKAQVPKSISHTARITQRSLQFESFDKRATGGLNISASEQRFTEVVKHRCKAPCVIYLPVYRETRFIQLPGNIEIPCLQCEIPKIRCNHRFPGTQPELTIDLIALLIA